MSTLNTMWYFLQKNRCCYHTSWQGLLHRPRMTSSGSFSPQPSRQKTMVITKLVQALFVRMTRIVHHDLSGNWPSDISIWQSHDMSSVWEWETGLCLQLKTKWLTRTMKRIAVVPDVDMILALLGMSWMSEGSSASATRSNSLPSCCDRKLQSNHTLTYVHKPFIRRQTQHHQWTITTVKQHKTLLWSAASHWWNTSVCRCRTLPNSGTVCLTASFLSTRLRPSGVISNIICSRSPTRTLFCDFCTVTPLVVLAVVNYLGHSKKILIDWLNYTQRCDHKRQRGILHPYVLRIICCIQILQEMIQNTALHRFTSLLTIISLLLNHAKCKWTRQCFIQWCMLF